MNANAQTLRDYYMQTLIAQYFNAPKAYQTIAALIVGTGDYGLVANALANQVRDGFDLETALGAQLDILGKLIGPDRYFNSLDLSKEFLPLVDYDDPGVGTYPGIADYDDATQPPAIYTMTYEDFVENTLQDGDYRRVLEFEAAVRSCDFSYEILDSICYTYFAGNVNLKVTGTMQITYQHLTSDTDNLFSIVSQMGLLPAPAGVETIVAEVASF